MKNRQTTQTRVGRIDEAFQAGPLPRPIPPAPLPELLPPEVPGATTVELNPDARQNVPVGPVTPIGTHLRPGSPLTDPARELKLEAEEQERTGEFMP